MDLIRIDELIIEERQRKDFDDKFISELADDIADKGLYHAVLCVDKPPLTLVAGESRIRAIRLLNKQNRLFSYNDTVVPPGQVPYSVISGALTERKIYEAELHENIMRRNLTWQEETQAYAKLHRMRQEENPNQTYKDTALEITKAKDIEYNSRRAREVSRAVVLEGFLDDEEVKKAKTSQEAFNIASRKLNTEFKQELRKRNLNKKKIEHTLLFGDALEQLPEIKERFHTIISDPPYGIGVEDFGDAAKLRHEYEDDIAVAVKLIELCFGLCRPKGHMFVFCDVDHFLTLRETARSVGWRPLRTPLIWNKRGSGGHTIGQGFGIRRKYEMCLMLFNGTPTVTEVTDDVLDAASPPRDKTHAAQKSVEIYEKLIGLSTFSGGKVLDPCCGSGTIFEAAKNTGCVATGIELSENYFKAAQERLYSLYDEENEDAE